MDAQPQPSTVEVRYAKYDTFLVDSEIGSDGKVRTLQLAQGAEIRVTRTDGELVTVSDAAGRVIQMDPDMLDKTTISANQNGPNIVEIASSEEALQAHKGHLHMAADRFALESSRY